MRSPQPTSSIEPTERKALNPTCSRRLQSKTDVQSAPLWLMNATLPRRAILFAKVAFKPSSGIMMPRQFGPITCIWPRRARISSSSLIPAAPHSLKPADMITAPGTPAVSHSPTTSGTVNAGVAMTARSTAAGTSAILGNAFTPSTLGLFGLIG